MLGCMVKQKKQIGHDCYIKSVADKDLSYWHNSINSCRKNQLYEITSLHKYEIYYSYHCYECSDADRISFLLHLDSSGKASFSVFSINNKVICWDKDIQNDLLVNIVEKATGQFFERDCAVEGGTETTILTRDIETDKIITYFNSLGVSGDVFDESNQVRELVNLTSQITSLVCF